MSGLIVHEWIARDGGSERVLEQFRDAFVDADVQVLWNDLSEIDGVPRETWLARTGLRSHKALSIPFQMATWRRLRAEREYDWMLVSSHLFAHHARIVGQDGLKKYVYAHTPARYIWEPSLDQRGASIMARAASFAIKPVDRLRARDATRIAANSDFTRQRIRRAWRRDADVIFPPVDVDRIIEGGDWSERLNDADRRQLDALPEGYLLGASRMIPYKRLDLVIRAGEATSRPVVLAGDGPLFDELVGLARQSDTTVQVLRRPSDALLFALYQRASAFIFPAVEDFGIMPVEAMAAGVPVITLPVGGAFESVHAVNGGVFVDGFDRAGWVRAIEAVQDIDRTALSERTRRFSNQRFKSEISAWMGLDSR